MTRQPRRCFATAATAVIAIPALFSACDQPTDSRDGSWLRAQVRGAVDATYEGTGYFHIGSDPRVGVSVKFTLNSDAVGEHAGQQFMLYRPGKGRPSKGVFPLGPLETESGSPEGFTAYYSRVVDGQYQAYTTRSGEVNVTESSGSRVEGSFRLIGVLYCRGSTSGVPDSDWWCTGPNTLTPGAPEIEITGSFLAVPSRPGPIVEESRVGGP